MQPPLKLFRKMCVCVYIYMHKHYTILFHASNFIYVVSHCIYMSYFSFLWLLAQIIFGDIPLLNIEMYVFIHIYSYIVIIAVFKCSLSSRFYLSILCITSHINLTTMQCGDINTYIFQVKNLAGGGQFRRPHGIPTTLITASLAV